jgi:outer membrane lipoprotein SlyB
MADVREQVARVKANWIGGVAGGVLGVVAARKFGKVQNKWALIGIGLAGVVIGAMAQSKIAAKKGAPTKKVVEGTK